MNDRFKFRYFYKPLKIMCEFQEKDYLYEFAEKENYVLMQCTGLKDKNGKLIYEGDICEYEFEEIGKQKAIIEFNQKYAAFFAKPLNDFQYANINDCEVIGNIYENKELLNENS